MTPKFLETPPPGTLSVCCYTGTTFPSHEYDGSNIFPTSSHVNDTPDMWFIRIESAGNPPVTPLADIHNSASIFDTQ